MTWALKQGLFLRKRSELRGVLIEMTSTVGHTVTSIYNHHHDYQLTTSTLP